MFENLLWHELGGFSGEDVFSPLSNLVLRKFDRQYYDSKICQTPKRIKNHLFCASLAILAFLNM